MSAVFSHGRLRLYLLHLLHEQPRHGYELIRLLEDRFLGTYAPSAGTIYPRLARLEAEGLVTHDLDAGRKVFRLTEAGEEELARRAHELDEVEDDIAQSVLTRPRRTEDVHRSAGICGELRVAAESCARAAAQRREGQPATVRTRRGLRAPSRDLAGAPATSGRRDDVDRQSEPASAVARSTAAERLSGEIRRAAARAPIERDAVDAAAQVLDDALERLRRALRSDDDDKEQPPSPPG